MFFHHQLALDLTKEIYDEDNKKKLKASDIDYILLSELVLGYIETIYTELKFAMLKIAYSLNNLNKMI